MVAVILWRRFLYTPVEVGQKERNGASNPREVVIIDKDDAAPAQQSTEIEEIDEHAIEAMVSIHEAKIESAPRFEKSR